MLYRLRSTFGARRAKHVEDADTFFDATASMIAAGLRRLQAVGLQPFADMQDNWRSISREIAEKYALATFIRPPTEMTWPCSRLPTARSGPSGTP